MGYTINSSENKHNGWTNYATWRVNLEIFDNMERDYFTDEVGASDPYTLSERLKEFAENVISYEGSAEGLAMDYARAFLAEVNFYEIAQHMIEDAKVDAA